jgi:hypothetical protein
MSEEIENLKKKTADLEALVETLVKEKEASSRELTVGNEVASDLRKRVRSLLQPTPKFKPEDVVRWKKGLKNKKYPKEDQVAMVIEELTTPIQQGERDSGSPYFNEPLDLVLGVLDDDEDLMVFHYDKRRFELAT